MNDVEYIRQALQETGIHADPLDAAGRLILVAKLLGSFDVNVDHTFPWETSRAPTVSQIRHDAWELIPRLVGENPCIMFAEYGETLFRFRNGDDLRAVVGEWHGDEFYVCDEQVTYLLCQNHHDYLVGWGAARDWVAALPSLSYSYCIVCGYRASLSPAYEHGSRLDGTCCVCCGVRHGDEDSTLPEVHRFRATWLTNGAPWHEPAATPKNWNLEEQLLATAFQERFLTNRSRME